MSDTWFLVVDAAGECRSMGTRVADPLPVGLEAVALSPADAAAIRDGSGVWVAPARAVQPVLAPVPESITPWQLHTWLWQRRGITQAQVAGLLAALPQAQREQAEIDLQNALSFRRNHPLVETFGAALGMAAAEIDDAFREAAELA